jgi:hypothetical protein
MIGETLKEIAESIETGRFGRKLRVGVTVLGSEHGPEEIIRGAEMAQAQNLDIEVCLVGAAESKTLKVFATTPCEADQHQTMEQLLDAGELDACVTMHYNFPVGVATVGRVITPGRGRELILATTTGTAATERVEAMVRNAVAGIATAKALGIGHPTVGVLNVDGARQVDRALRTLQENGYDISFAGSVRADGGSVMRGNDLLVGAPDVMVQDTLTGNLLMKVFSAYTSGCDYEMLGYGYGPGVGADYNRIIMILSRASGAPVVAGAIKYAAQVAAGKLPDVARSEFAAAEKAGLSSLFKQARAVAPAVAEEVKPPARKVVTADIPGVDILQIEDAVRALWKVGLYAETGMGCTGPVILTAPEDREKAVAALKDARFL